MTNRQMSDTELDIMASLTDDENLEDKFKMDTTPYVPSVPPAGGPSEDVEEPEYTTDVLDKIKVFDKARIRSLLSKTGTNQTDYHKFLEVVGITGEAEIKVLSEDKRSTVTETLTGKQLHKYHEIFTRQSRRKGGKPEPKFKFIVKDETDKNLKQTVQINRTFTVWQKPGTELNTVAIEMNVAVDMARTIHLPLAYIKKTFGKNDESSTSIDMNEKSSDSAVDHVADNTGMHVMNLGELLSNNIFF
jgi:hypothetical protein